MAVPPAPGTWANEGVHTLDRVPADQPTIRPDGTTPTATRRILVGGFGGGSGRTTVAAGLGMALAAGGRGRVVAVDACPDQCGLLTRRVGLLARGVGLRELIQAQPPVSTLTDLRRFLATEGPGGLEVLPGVHDLAGPGLTSEELAWALDLVGRWFPMVIADAPPGWSQPVPATLLARSNQVLLTARAGEAELAGADDALTALSRAGGAGLAASAVVAVVETYPARLTRTARQRFDRLAGRTRAMVTVPFDPGLADARPFGWRQLRRRTRAAFEELAAALDRIPDR